MTQPPGRRNLTQRSAEDFRPPVFRPNSSAVNRLLNWGRRFLDIQAGSIWRDLSRELAGSSGNLLDVGCGAQIYRALVPPRVAYRGIDTADAEARFGYAVPDTDYFTGDIWPVADTAYDTVLCTEVLEHVADPAAFLAEARRVLRPGGRLVLTVPFAARWHFIPFDYWRFTPSSMAMLLAGAGFTDTGVQARGNPLTVACYKTMTLLIMLLTGGIGDRFRLAQRIAGIVMLPGLGALACIANLSMRYDWGDDCIGYTVSALRAGDS